MYLNHTAQKGTLRMYRFLPLRLPQAALIKILFSLHGLHRNLESFFIFIALCAGLMVASPTLSHAQSFSAVVSPPRFELTAQPGKTIRQLFEITQASNDKGSYRLYTNDWVIGADGTAIFSDELAPNSCRSWVSIERREISIAGNAKIRFRFEITVPTDAVAGECRFAIMIEGTEQVVKAAGALSFPVSGRVGVGVYAAIGDAAPKFEITQGGTRVSDGVVVPMLSIKNTGNAHGRPFGFLKSKDQQGQQVDFSPEPLPILPGQTRLVALIPQFEAGVATKLVYPLTVTGAVEWGEAPGSKKTDIDFRFDGLPATPPTAAPKQPALLPLPTSKSPDTKKLNDVQSTNVQSTAAQPNTTQPPNPGVVPK